MVFDKSCYQFLQTQWYKTSNLYQYLDLNKSKINFFLNDLNKSSLNSIAKKNQ